MRVRIQGLRSARPAVFTELHQRARGKYNAGGKRRHFHMRLIRRAEVGDARVVAAIYVESWNRGLLGLMPSRSLTDTMVSRWERQLALPGPHRWWVAEIDGSIVGFAGIGPSRDPIQAHRGELDTI